MKEKVKLRHSDLDLQARSISPKATTSPINVEHKYQLSIKYVGQMMS